MEKDVECCANCTRYVDEKCNIKAKKKLAHWQEKCWPNTPPDYVCGNFWPEAR